MKDSQTILDSCILKGPNNLLEYSSEHDLQSIKK